MPSRNFCDICDSKIPNTEPIYSIEIETPENAYLYNRNDVLQFYTNPFQHRINIALDFHMVCHSCIVNIRKYIQEMREDAVSERPPT